jgi:MarR family transcriptional regulator, organic hydroperoxide resistance regulator
VSRAKGPSKRVPKTPPTEAATEAILRHWREAVPNDRLAHLIKDATRGLVRALQMRLAEHAVSFGHWTFLRILWESDGLTQRELSVQAGLMEKLGYVVRRQRPDNRKNVHVYLTPKGRALKSRLVPLAEEVNEIAVRGISAADVAATRRALLAMIENLARDDGESAKRKQRVPSTRELARIVADAGNGRRPRGVGEGRSAVRRSH